MAVRRVNDYRKLKEKYLNLRAKGDRRGKYHLARKNQPENAHEKNTWKEKEARRFRRYRLRVERE